MPKRIAISTGGGDAPGLNAVIRAVTKMAISEYGWEVVGIKDGFDGLLKPDHIMPLGLDDIRGIIARGGTILGTTNRGNPFKYPVVEDGQTVLKDVSDQVVQRYHDLGLDALVLIGGDGTLGIGHDLAKKGINLVGVPKTIDNDLNSTDQTFGFDTAVVTATEAIDKLLTTAESHHRVMVLEVMGRTAGWIALKSGMAGAVNVILVPEIPFDMEKVAQAVYERSEAGKSYSIVVVAEGAAPAGAGAMYADLDPTKNVARLGGVGNWVGAEIIRRTGLETRVTVLGHLQRGGTPSPYDRILGTRFGVEACRLVHEGKFDQMVCLRAGHVTHVPIAEAIDQLKLIDPNSELVQAARHTGVYFGD
ncbi:MAG TPA: ATP-dependent 6-phosphofructokinase [Pantanalinema sp.]